MFPQITLISAEKNISVCLRILREKTKSLFSFSLNHAADYADFRR
jgi:hypothetical protein